MKRERIGTRIGILRSREKISQADLADALGVKRETIKFWESGDRHVKEDDIIKLAEYFKVSSDYLLGLSNTPERDTEIKQVCAYTGLSSEAIKILHNLPEKENGGNIYISLINEIIAGPTLNFFGINAHRYAVTKLQCEYGDGRYDTEKKEQDETTESILQALMSGDEKVLNTLTPIPSRFAWRFYLQQATDAIGNAAKRTLNDYYERIEYVIKGKNKHPRRGKDIGLDDLDYIY